MTTTDDINIQIDPEIFNEVYVPHLHCQSRVQIFFGGASSGKSMFLVQRSILDVLEGHRNYLICRAVGKSIRNSIFNEFVKVLREWGLDIFFNIRYSNLSLECSNGRQIFFAGLDDPQKLKSITPTEGVITDILIEEATEVSYRAIKELEKRLRGQSLVKKRLTLVFNPIYQDHHIYQRFFIPIGWGDDQQIYQSDDLLILRTWYIHNRFLAEDDIEALEGETDKYYREVYTYGLWGVLGNLIFPRHKVVDLSAYHRHFVNLRNGLDFGFGKDPAEFGTVHLDIKHKRIFVFQEFSGHGYTNDLLAIEVLKLIGKKEIICDSAEPKSIKELQNHGVSARGAKKGPDSKRHGIQWLQQFDIYIDSSCVSAIGQIKKYKWAEGPDGKPLPYPVEHDDHFIDWLRYATEADMRASRNRKATTKSRNYLVTKKRRRQDVLPY